MRFSMVSGVPKYWELVSRGQSGIALAQALFFGSATVLEFELARLDLPQGRRPGESLLH